MPFEIETPRLVLRDFRESDIAAVFEYQSDPRYLELSPWVARYEQEVRDFVRMLIGWADEDPRTKFQLAIVRSGTLVGNCGIRLSSVTATEGEFGCELDPRCWRNGYALEAGVAMLDFAFDTLRVQRVFSETLADNAAAIAIAQRLGMKRAEQVREPQQIKGRQVDTLVLEISRGDWRAR